MVTGPARINDLEAGRELLVGGSVGGGSTLVVPVRAVVPSWLVELAAEAADLGIDVLVEAEPPADLDGEALDGWEIGVCTAALASGAADVIGVDPRRVARVREIGDLLVAHASQVAPGSAS